MAVAMFSTSPEALRLTRADAAGSAGSRLVFAAQAVLPPSSLERQSGRPTKLQSATVAHSFYVWKAYHMDKIAHSVRNSINWNVAPGGQIPKTRLI